MISFRKTQVFHWQAEKKLEKPSVLADLGPKRKVFARFFQLFFVFQCLVPSVPSSFPFLPCSALWFLSGSQCPPAWRRIALGVFEIVFRRKTQWILQFSAKKHPKRRFFQLFLSFFAAFPCEILIFPNEITCFHQKPLFSPAKSYFLNAWLPLPQPYGS